MLSAVRSPPTTTDEASTALSPTYPRIGQLPSVGGCWVTRTLRRAVAWRTGRLRFVAGGDCGEEGGGGGDSRRSGCRPNAASNP